MRLLFEPRLLGRLSWLSWLRVDQDGSLAHEISILLLLLFLFHCLQSLLIFSFHFCKISSCSLRLVLEHLVEQLLNAVHPLGDVNIDVPLERVHLNVKFLNALIEGVVLFFDVFLELDDLLLISSDHSVEMVLTFACLLVESLFELSQLLLLDLTELVNCALPTLALEIVVDFRLHDYHEESFLVFGTFLGKNRGVLSEDSKFHLDLFHITLLHQLIKDIAHDGDEHVEHGDLCEKSGTEEHTDHQTRCSTHHEVLANLELAQHQQVLVVNSIHHPPSKTFLYNELLTIIPAQIEHVDWQAKHEHGGEK